MAKALRAGHDCTGGMGRCGCRRVPRGGARVPVSRMSPAAARRTGPARGSRGAAAAGCTRPATGAARRRARGAGTPRGRRGGRWAAGRPGRRRAARGGSPVGRRRGGGRSRRTARRGARAPRSAAGAGRWRRGHVWRGPVPSGRVYPAERPPLAGGRLRGWLCTPGGPASPSDPLDLAARPSGRPADIAERHTHVGRPGSVRWRCVLLGASLRPAGGPTRRPTTASAASAAPAVGEVRLRSAVPYSPVSSGSAYAPLRSASGRRESWRSPTPVPVASALGGHPEGHMRAGRPGSRGGRRVWLSGRPSASPEGAGAGVGAGLRSDRASAASRVGAAVSGAGGCPSGGPPSVRRTCRCCR